MFVSVADKRARFRALHGAGCFLLPNPWDVGSARLFESIGFDALASTSTGFAWTHGKPDYALTVEDVLGHLSELSAATSLPVNADFESGFADDLSGLADNVRRAIDAGVSGLSIEDRKVGSIDTLYETAEAVERIKAARAAIKASGEDVILVARTEGLLIGGSVKDAVDRLVALADAGADCIYAPGIGMPGLSAIEDVGALVRAVAPKPVNVLVATPGVSLQALADLGVQRVSIGGALALVGWGAVRDAARRMKDGDFESFANAMPGGDLNKLFGEKA